MQWTLLASTSVVLLIGAVQTGIVLHTRSVVANAALAAAEARALFNAPSGAGDEAARSVAAQSGLSSITVTSTLTATLVTVTVTSPVPALVGIGPRQVSATASVPKER